MTSEMLIGLIEEAGYKTVDHPYIAYMVSPYRVLHSVATIVAGTEDAGTRMELTEAFRLAEADSLVPGEEVMVQFPYLRPK